MVRMSITGCTASRGSKFSRMTERSGLHEQTAVKCRDWVLKLKIVNQHLHAPWRPAAGDGKSDSHVYDSSNGGTCARRHDFVGSDQRPINICHHQAYIFRGFFFAFHMIHLSGRFPAIARVPMQHLQGSAGLYGVFLDSTSPNESRVFFVSGIGRCHLTLPTCL